MARFGLGAVGSTTAKKASKAGKAAKAAWVAGAPSRARSAYASAWGGTIMGPGSVSVIGKSPKGINFDPYKRAARGMQASKAMAGKGKYIAGAVAGGYAVGGVMRNTTGSTKAVGRPTGIYGY